MSERLGVDDKSLGKMVTTISQAESFEVAKDICKDLKLDIKNIDDEKHLIKGKTKLSWTKNKFAKTFLVVVNASGSNSIIDVYYEGIGMRGPDSGTLIQPFYKKFIEKTNTSPELETGQIRIKWEDIEKSANEYVSLPNQVESSTHGTIPKDSEKTIQQITENPIHQQTLVQGSSNQGHMSSTTPMTLAQLKQFIGLKHDQYKAQWDKSGIVQFKSEHVAILQRMWGSQVQFIVAYDQLTKEGYRLMAIDEGKTGGQASGGFTGGVNAYFYFQKMEFVR